MAPEECPACGGTRELRVPLDFQLGAGDGDFKLISALLPQQAGVYPFLVVLEGGAESKQFCCMPYWHDVGEEARYGQHAVCLDHAKFDR